LVVEEILQISVLKFAHICETLKSHKIADRN
jgi:hypothetical protein